MTDKAYAVPLHELLARVPRDARLVIDDPDGMGTQYIPVGRYCHEAAETLRAKLNEPELAQPEPEPVAVFRREILGRGQIFWLRSSDELPNETPLYTTPPQREQVKFPTMLRKMWSGSEVQAWLDENVNKEKNT